MATVLTILGMLPRPLDAQQDSVSAEAAEASTGYRVLPVDRVLDGVPADASGAWNRSGVDADVVRAMAWRSQTPEATGAAFSQQDVPLLPMFPLESPFAPVLPAPAAGADGLWQWQLLPDGKMYESYLAGTKQSRIGGAWLYANDGRWLWDVTLGGRVGIVRLGTNHPVAPEGWQLEIEGGADLRLDVEQDSDVESVDFRFAIPLTYRRGPFAAKFGYGHISSHLGDEFLLRHPGISRINYSRDSLLLGLMYWLHPDLRVYTELGWAFSRSGGAEPLELQLGLDYSPAFAYGWEGAPFVGINAHLREDVDLGGGMNLVTGWQWRGAESDNLLRIGLQYYNGKSLQYSFFNQHEELIGLGLWYDY